MDEAQIYARLAKIFEEVLDQGSIEMTPELSVRDMDGWDSLSNIRLILTIEKEFNVNFLTSEMSKLDSVGDFVEVIKGRTEGKA